MKRVWIIAGGVLLLGACGSDKKSSATTSAVGATAIATVPESASAPATTTVVPTTTSTTSTTTTTTIAATTTTECAPGSQESRNITDQSFERWTCNQGHWELLSIVSITTTTQPAPPTTIAPIAPITPEEFRAVLEEPAAAWLKALSSDAAAANLLVAVLSLRDAGRPLPETSGEGATAKALIGLLAHDIAGDPARAVEILGQFEEFLPGLPPIVSDGSYTVGEDIQPGRYRTAFAVSGCYWETLNEAGETNNNNFVNAAPQVIATIRKNDFAFNSDGCGPWLKIG